MTMAFFRLRNAAAAAALLTATLASPALHAAEVWTQITAGSGSTSLSGKPAICLAFSFIAMPPSFDTALQNAASTIGKMIELSRLPDDQFKKLAEEGQTGELDLDDVACAAAKGLGVPVVISTDSHRADGLAAMRYGVQQARRGGLTKADVANTRTWPQLRKLLGD